MWPIFCGKSLRKMDMVFRYGGDEFMIIMPETNLSQAFTGLKRLREDFNAKQAARAKRGNEGGPFKPVTFSMGVAQLEPGESPEALIKRAEQALVEAAAHRRQPHPGRGFGGEHQYSAFPQTVPWPTGGPFKTLTIRKI